LWRGCWPRCVSNLAVSPSTTRTSRRRGEERAHEGGEPRQRRTRTGEDQRRGIAHCHRREGMHNNQSAAARAPPGLLAQANGKRVTGPTYYSTQARGGQRMRKQRFIIGFVVR